MERPTRRSASTGFKKASIQAVADIATVMVEADVYVGLSEGCSIRLDACRTACMPYKPVPRLKEFSYTGLRRYSLTICVRDRKRVFVSSKAVDPVLLQLVQTSNRYQFAIIAYCFMPDHLHLLVEATADDSNLAEFVRVFKQCSSYHWKTVFGHLLWQRSYFEHVLRDDESPVKAARYILGNPLRAAIVETVEDYPFLGSMTMTVRDLLYSVSED